jgi:hypothetical protein
VANAVSGNYCQPRCDEPTTEVKFANPKQGSLQVIIAPLTKLTRKVGATIDQIGDLPGVINSIGPYITGDFIEPEDVVGMKELNDNGKKVPPCTQQCANLRIGNCRDFGWETRGWTTSCLLQLPSSSDVRKVLLGGAWQYFVYELNTPYAMTGVYNLACVTTSQNELVMIVVSASEKQYAAAEASLRRIAESFRI